jgi:hypothetical protein
MQCRSPPFPRCCKPPSSWRRISISTSTTASTGRRAALWLDVRERAAVRGASSITEQVVRMIHPRPRSAWSRWVAGFEAARLEKRFSKTQILEFYLNQVPYAERRRGVVQFEALPMQVAAVPGIRRVDWYVDGGLAASTPDTRYPWPLQRGAHRVRALMWTDTDGARTTDDVRFEVR